MMKSRSIHPLVWLLVTPAVLCVLTVYALPQHLEPVNQRDLLTHKVYAYRQWQSMGVWLTPGDRVDIRASGEWSYSPYVGLHGPEGGEWAPDWYPMTGNQSRALGGLLLGRVGEDGAPFWVGSRATEFASEPGLLYLRINDDLLGDNTGVLQVEIEVTPAPTPVP